MDLYLLYELQQQEINFQKLNKRLDQLKGDDYLNRLKHEYLDLKQRYLDLIEKKDKEEKNYESEKQLIRQLEENKKSYEKLKYSPEINNSKKLKMIEKQISDAGKNIDEGKKKIEEIINKITIIKDEISSVKKKIIFIKNKYENTKENNKRELEFLEKEKINIETLIKDIKEQIDEKSIIEYSRMKSRFDDPISVIESKKCGGCSMDIPSIKYESAKIGDIVKCESCGRVLFYKKGK